MKIGLLSILILCAVVSCTDFDREEQLGKVDKLSQQVDSLQVALKEHRVDTLVHLRTAVTTLELRIRNNYNADTINMSLGKKMEKFRHLKKFFMAEHEVEGEEESEGEGLNHQTLGSAYLAVKRGIMSEKSTLLKLRSDISNGSGKRDKYNEYISFEAGKVNQLCVLLEDYKSHKDKILTNFKEVYGELNAFATQLESKKLKLKK
jgi:hypothetical protein